MDAEHAAHRWRTVHRAGKERRPVGRAPASVPASAARCAVHSRAHAPARRGDGTVGTSRYATRSSTPSPPATAACSSAGTRCVRLQRARDEDAHRAARRLGRRAPRLLRRARALGRRGRRGQLPHCGCSPLTSPQRGRPVLSHARGGRAPGHADPTPVARARARHPSRRDRVPHRERRQAPPGRLRRGRRPGPSSADGVFGLARTAVDIGREHGFEDGVVACDAALRLGLPRRELWRVLDGMTAGRTSPAPGPPYKSPTEARRTSGRRCCG